MTARTVRIIVIVVCVGGVAGMIVTTVLHHSGAALTFGLLTTVAVLCLMVATAVTAGAPPAGQHLVAGQGARATSGDAGHTEGVDREADLLERQVEALVAKGVDEREVRDLVRQAVRLGRTLPSSSGPP